MRRSVALISAFVIAFFAGLVVGYRLVNLTGYEERIADLETEVTVLNSQVSTLEAEKSGLESQLRQLEQQLEIEILGVHFSPKGGCEDQIIYWIGRANASAHVLIYSFTLDSIGDALVEAHQRGVEVQVVFEKGRTTEKSSEYQKLKEAGITARNDTNSRLMHDKILVVDGIVVLTGSFNWSNNAENYNNENLIVIESTYIAGIYEQEFAEIWNESV